MRDVWKNGTKVRFTDTEKYDDNEHSVLNVQILPNDVCYFLHYWSWIDEDELELVEDMTKQEIDKSFGVKVGDFFNDGTLSQVTKIEENRAYYDEIGNYVDIAYVFHHRINVVEDTIKEDVVQLPTHYNSTSITALQVIDDWNLDFYLGNVVKYIKRHELKGNAVQDLKKAAQYLQLKIDKLVNEKEGKTAN